MEGPDPGCPCPDMERLEVAHDLLSTALGRIQHAMDEADRWDATRHPDEAECCETERVLAIQSAIDGAAMLAQAGQNLAPLAERQLP